MMGFLIKIGLFFIKPKTAPLAWGGVALALLVGYGFWSWTTVQDLKRDKIEMVIEHENEALKNSNEQLTLDQESMMSRMEALAGSLENLNSSYSRNAQRRQTSFDNMTTVVPSGEAPDTNLMRQRANDGMNSLFTELETISGKTPE